MIVASIQARNMSGRISVKRSILVAAATGGLFASYLLGGSTRGIANDAGRGGKVPPGRLSPVQVTSWLREHEESYYVDRGKGCVRYDVSQLPSNSPIEDDRSERVLNVKLAVEQDDQGLGISSADWMFWGVYDGHSGWTTSAVLRESLINSVISELGKVFKKSSPNAETRLVPSEESSIDGAIKRGFENLDDAIVNKSVEKLLNQNVTKSEAAQLLAPALSGSCGLLAFYDSQSSQLRVAVTGDSRAVLGSMRDASGKWTATALSTDQTGSNQDEANRVRSEHPGEESTAIFRGRVLGSLEPTRAFGDAKYKWSRSIQEKISSKFFGRRTPSELRSPPYVTASPVVTTTKIYPGDFVVLASDGLYEMLSNEEVVSLVAKWIDEKHPELLPNPQASDSRSSWFNWGAKSKRHEVAVEDISLNKDAQKQPIRKQTNSQFVPTVQDENCATHLIRNALGGADQQQVSMLVSIPSPMSRSYRDDLTVTVVFFGDQSEPDENGTVNINSDGTARVKSKL